MESYKWPFNSKATDIVNTDIPERERTVDRTIKDCMFALIDSGECVKRSELRKMDTIDITKFAEECIREGKYAEAPAFHTTEEERALYKSNWFVLIPPLSSGVIKLNRDRYLKYSVEDLRLEDKEYTVLIEDYAYEDGIWMMNWCFDSLIRYEDGEISHGETGRTFASICEMVLDGDIDDVEFDEFTKRYLRGGVLEQLKRNANSDDFVHMANVFIHAILKVNTELMSGERPRAKRNTSSGTSSSKAVVDIDGKAPKKQIIRTLKSGITITSVKPPKAPNAENIRHYKVEAWNQRGHVRHYKSGKEVYIKPQVKTRKCFGDGEKNVSQTYIISNKPKEQRKEN